MKAISCRIPVLMVVVGLACFTISCSKGSSYGSGTNTGTQTNTVIMQGMSFSITTLRITKGATVTWKNTDNTTHTVTADDNSFNSGDVTAGNSYSRTFDVQGTFPYHCTYHSPMKGTVIVN